MAKYKVQVATAADSILARDAIVNTFHLSDVGTGSDPDQLASDTADLWQNLYGTNRQVEVKLYDAEQPTSFPVGRSIKSEGQAPASNRPREVAVCLSYYGERNLPRTRGRMFICPAIGLNLTMDNVRVPQGTRTQLLEHAVGISNLGGADVDWVVWSSIDGANEKVQHAWVDDEWDTMRSRGLRATTRDLQAIDE